MAPAASEEKNPVPNLTPQFLYGVKKGVNGGLNFLGKANNLTFWVRLTIQLRSAFGSVCRSH